PRRRHQRGRDALDDRAAARPGRGSVPHQAAGHRRVPLDGRAAAAGGGERAMSVSALSNCTLVVVDDEPANLDLLEQILVPEGFTNLVRTTDAREALPRFERTCPNLVLLDLHMPYRSGF